MTREPCKIKPAAVIAPLAGLLLGSLRHRGGAIPVIASPPSAVQAPAGGRFVSFCTTAGRMLQRRRRFLT